MATKHVRFGLAGKDPYRKVYTDLREGDMSSAVLAHMQKPTYSKSPG